MNLGNPCKSVCHTSNDTTIHIPLSAVEVEEVRVGNKTKRFSVFMFQRNLGPVDGCYPFLFRSLVYLSLICSYITLLDKYLSDG